MKRLLVTLAALLVAAAFLPACGDTVDEAALRADCDGNVQQQLDDNEVELIAAKAEARNSRDTPAGDTADTMVEQLEAQRAELNECNKAPAESTTTTSANAECGDRFVTKLDENEKNRVLSGGVKAVSSEEMRQELLDFNSRDPRGLYLYYNAVPAFALSPIDDVASLFEGGEVESGVCFSEEGMEKYQEWSVMWKAARIEEAPSMPAGWGNTGVSNGAPTSGPAPSGNTEGWLVIFVDAEGKEIGAHGVMKRCGNPVTPSPVAPSGPTDEPTPPAPERPPAAPKCPPPPGVPPRFWDYEKCVKKNTDFDYQQNQSQARQDPQDNSTSGVPTGPTPGAPPTPYVPPRGPTPRPNSPAPPPTPGGYDSGSPSGSGTPGGSTCDSGGCSGGGPTPAPSGPPVTVDNGTHSGDPGGF